MDDPTQFRHESRQQNVYDDPTFFAGYRRLRRDNTGLNDLEQPALRACLPELGGRSLLDLGCGFGDFAAWSVTQGANPVVAVDVSERMLAERIVSPGLVYVRSAIEEIQFSADTFDVVVSSLALHYVADFHAVARSVASWLRPGGVFAFSVEHPMATATMLTAHDGSPGTYDDESGRVQEWFVPGVRKYHRTQAHYTDSVVEAGFVQVDVNEPIPTLVLLDRRPDFGELVDRPPFLVVSCVRP